VATAARQRRAVVPRLYAIADRDALGDRHLPEAVAAMAAAGVRWIQVRAKGVSGAAAFGLVEACCRALEGTGVTLWVDDRVDLATLLPVGGVHLGQHDLPPAAARPLLPAATLIGASTHDLSQLAAAAADPAVDVVALGPIFATTSKQRPDPTVGVAMLRQARRLTDKPLLAIGGIGEGNLGEVLAAGADAVVVLSAACRDEVGASCRALLAAVEAA
jgi:thiamine-phosphate pyrophosphorylase